MAFKPKSIKSKAAGASSVEIDGLKELEGRIKDLLPFSHTGRIEKELNEALNGASEFMRDQMRAKAAAAGWPASIQKFIFSQSEAISSGERKRMSALAGVSKGHATIGHPMYRDWVAGAQKSKLTGRRSPRAKVAKGERHVGMGFPTMWEFGTIKIPARPAIRPAIQATRERTIQYLIANYQNIIEKYLGK